MAARSRTITGMRARHGLPLVCAALVLGACPWIEPPPGPEVCEDDVHGCEGGLEWKLDEACELEGELEVVMGEGERNFTGLGPDEMPSAYFGFQGGQHVWMGVQVQNPSLDHPLIQVEYELELCYGDSCTSPGAAWDRVGIRSLALDDSTMELTPQNFFEQASIQIILENWDTSAHRRVTMVVTDPCGREGTAVHQSEPEN